MNTNTKVATIEPLAVRAADAAALVGLSEASWWRMNSGAKIPAPVKLNGSTVWPVAELRAWIAAGAPDRRTWEALKAAR